MIEDDLVEPGKSTSAWLWHQLRKEKQGGKLIMTERQN